MHADFSTTVITYGWCNPTKVNKTLLTDFYSCIHTHRPEPSSSLSHTVTLGGPPATSLEREVSVINEWPLKPETFKTTLVCTGCSSRS